MDNKPIWRGSEDEVSDLKKWLKTMKFQTTYNSKHSSTKNGGYWSLRGLGSHLDEQNRSETGPNGWRQRLENPNRSFSKTQKNCRKTVEKSTGRRFWPVFLFRSQKRGWKVQLGVQVTVFGLKSATSNSGCPGGRFAEKLSSQLRLMSVTCAIGPETRGS